MRMLAVLLLAACGPRDDPPPAPSALRQSMQRPIERARDVQTIQDHAADEQRRKIDEATQ